MRESDKYFIYEKMIRYKNYLANRHLTDDLLEGVMDRFTKGTIPTQNELQQLNFHYSNMKDFFRYDK